MFTKVFTTKSAAVKYYGHSWSYIERHYKVQYCYSTATNGKVHYVISLRK